MKGRHESIRRALAHHYDRGVIVDWEASSPDGKRWSVRLFHVGSQVYSTREVEVLLQGLAAADLHASYKQQVTS